MAYPPVFEFVRPDDQACTLREVECQIANGELVLEFSNRYRHKAGSCLMDYVQS